MTRESSQSNHQSQLVFVSCGLSLALFLFFLMTATELGFVVGISPGPLTFSAAVFLSILVTALLQKGLIRELILGLCCALFLVVVACLASSAIYDFSTDGNTYHKQAVALLNSGWNPLHGSSENVPRSDIWGQSKSIWVDHYAQGTWCIGACFYAVFGDMEMAKCYTLIAMASAGTLLGGVLGYKGMRWWKAAIVAIIASINPLTLAQAFSFYVDGFLMMGLLLLLTGLATILFSANDAPMRRIGFVIVASAFVVCAETKFTGLAYAGVFSFSFYVLIAVKVLRGGLPKAFIIKTSGFFAVVIISSVFVFGFSPYVTNMLDHGHPFYPLFGEGAADIMTTNSPASFQESSHLRKLFLGFFSEASQPTLASGLEPIPKIPLTVQPEELALLKDYDLRISGFGVLYSAILLIDIPIVVLFLTLSRQRQPLLFQASLCYLIPTCILMLALDESWWARYSSYFYFMSPLALLLMFAYHPNHTSKLKRYSQIVVEILLASLLAINTALFFAYNTFHAYEATAEAKATIAKLEEAVQDGKKIQVLANPVAGAAYTLSDRGIPFEFIGTVGETDNIGEFDGFINGLAYRIVEE